MSRKNKFEVGLQVTYTDTSMCHRFITFEVGGLGKTEEGQFKEGLDEYVRTLYREEQGALMYHKIQEG